MKYSKDFQDNLDAFANQKKYLEPDESERSLLRKNVVTHTEIFLKDLPTANAYEQYNDRNERTSPYFEISESKNELQEILRFIKLQVTETGLNPASGGHLGYIPGGGIYISALADYIAAVTNSYAGVFFASPGAVRMENALIRWVAQLIGYKEGYAGNLTSGGSIANLIALATAKKAKQVSAKNIIKQVIYLSDQTHHSIKKGLNITGLNECVIRIIPSDKSQRMNISILASQIKDDRLNGLTPFLLIANAGTTNTGAVDKIEKIAKIASGNNIWLHVDAAYGGFFLITDHGKDLLKGIEQSDSVILDPHKALFLPYGSGMLLVKDKHCLLDANNYEADYMQDSFKHNIEESPSDLSPELSKHFRGLRMWLPLKLYGTIPFKDNLQEKLALAQYFYFKIKSLGFETGPFPDLTIVIFRYVPKKKDANEVNKHIITQLHKAGKIFITSTIIKEHFMLRAAVLSFRTHIKEIDLLLHLLKEIISELKADNSEIGN